MLSKITSATVGLLAACASAATLAMPATANAATEAASTQTFKNVATGFCLDSNANRDVYTLGCNGGSYQKWS